MSYKIKRYLIGSTIKTESFTSFFNEIKEALLDMGHTYDSDNSTEYTHIFKLNSQKCKFKNYDVKISIGLTDSSIKTLQSNSTNSEYRFLSYKTIIGDFFSSTANSIEHMATDNTATNFNGPFARYITIVEHQTDSLYAIDFLPYISDMTSYTCGMSTTSSTGYQFQSFKYYNFASETDVDAFSIGPTVYDSNLSSKNFGNPFVKGCSSKKILTNPIWIYKSDSSISNPISGYVKGLLATSKLDQNCEYTLNGTKYIPMSTSIVTIK